ncbi:hypothetical protein MC885_017439 [Smutsia gigantea]|nr:hypothetical protein MC885_017439 [Smutsia gigantea]
MSLWKRLPGPADSCFREFYDVLLTVEPWTNAARLPVSFSLAEFFSKVAVDSGREVFRPPPSSKMATAEKELLLLRLPELFETSKLILDQVEVAAESSGSRIIQDKVLKGLDLLNKAAEMLSQLDFFSQNEDLEEIASTDLKYLMVPAIQGALAMKQVNPSKRLDHLQCAREHFLNYLIQCQNYHVAEFKLPQTKNNSAENNTASSSVAYPSLLAMASQRQAKVERYKQKKEVEHRLSVLKSAVESCQGDDECVREYYLLHLRRWIGISLEEIESIDQEIKILKEKGFSEEASASNSSRQDRPPMKPFILTRNIAEAKVAQQQEDQEQKKKEDDKQTLHRAREWDEWKDTHPRGYGN